MRTRPAPAAAPKVASPRPPSAGAVEADVAAGQGFWCAARDTAASERFRGHGAPVGRVVQECRDADRQAGPCRGIERGAAERRGRGR